MILRLLSAGAADRDANSMNWHGLPAGIGGVLRCITCLRQLRRMDIAAGYECPSCGAAYADIDIARGAVL